MKEDLIFYVASKEKWKEGLKDGLFKPAELEELGYIPCHTGKQIEASANKHHKGETDLMLLVIDPMRVEGKVSFEKDEDTHTQVPRIHTALNTDAVIDKIELTPNDQGDFEIKVESN